VQTAIGVAAVLLSDFLPFTGQVGEFWKVDETD
jgi:hypothetical protein